MKIYKTKITIIFLGAIGLMNASCSWEDEFLDAKANQALAVPQTLEEYQSLLNNEFLFNSQDPSFGFLTGEDYYVTDARWESKTAEIRNAYVWESQIFEATEGTLANTWSGPYQQVYYANTVLDGIGTINVDAYGETYYNTIKGTALFYRAVAYYNLMQTFSLPYDIATADTDLGIPLRLNSDLNIKSTRASVSDCYSKILDDLKTSVNLLPESTTFKTQPSKVAALAMLARVYLGMSDYTNAFEYSQQSLARFSTLTDYNTLTPTSVAIHTDFPSEGIFLSDISVYPINSRVQASVLQDLYSQYEANDLRKAHFFYPSGNAFHFRGTYDYRSGRFSGLSNDEIYLIRAECYARQGNTVAALNDLNALLITRWQKDGQGNSTYTNKVAASADQALELILSERRKELVFRGLRWTDLRRLNKEVRFQTTLTRIVNGTTYTLAPNDKRYALPIPPSEIELSGLTQNER